MAEKINRLDRIARKIEGEVTRKQAVMERYLSEPAPPFAVKMREEDAFRRYLVHRSDGTLFSMRESNGGLHTDAEVDAYVRWGERTMAKHMPDVILREQQQMMGEVYAPNPDLDRAIQAWRMAQQRSAGDEFAPE